MQSPSFHATCELLGRVEDMDATSPEDHLAAYSAVYGQISGMQPVVVC